MQVAIAKKEDGETIELDDLTFQFILWLNENKYTELDPIYARSTLKTTVKDFSQLLNQHKFEGEDEMLVPQINYFIELGTWACFGKAEDEEITIVFEICDVVYDSNTHKESYRPIELSYLVPFLKSF